MIPCLDVCSLLTDHVQGLLAMLPVGTRLQQAAKKVCHLLSVGRYWNLWGHA